MRACLFCAILPLAASAVTIHPLKRAQNLSKRSPRFGLQNLAQSTNNGTVNLKNVGDLIYIANATIGGSEYSVQLDTGSSDFVMLSTISSANASDLTLNMTYGIGYVYGNIATTSVVFADVSVSQQAFLDSKSAKNPITSYGATGIMGLGFTSLSSVDATVQGATTGGGFWGRSFLFNVFAQSPNDPNYITFALERSSDGTTTEQGGFTIGEIDPTYSSVQSTPSIPTWPVSNPSRWNILFDAYETQSGKVPFTSAVSGIPTGQAVGLLDTGTSYVYAPEAFVTAIYGSVSGASFSSSLGQWVVPCTAQIYLGLWIGGRRFDIHPLDLVVPDLSDPKSCVGSFLPQGLAVGGGELDLIAGDVFLRNVYTVFDFGDFTDATNLTMGDPYIKLLSTTNITAASEEFNKVRGGTTVLKNSGPATVSSSSSAATSTTSKSNSITIDELSRQVHKIKSYTPALIAVLALNALIMLILVGVGVTLLLRKKKSAQYKRRAPTLSTMELNAPPTPSTGGPTYLPVALQNPDVPQSYDMPAYRQSGVSFRTDGAYRESAAL